MFYDCRSLEYLDISELGGDNFSSSNMFTYFNGAKEINMSHFNFGISSMSALFFGMENLELIDLSYINIRNVSTMNTLFGYNSKITRQRKITLRQTHSSKRNE
jgi:hypothetical protein